MLRAALASVLNQTHRQLEVIISDNASDDGTSDWLRHEATKDPRIRLVRLETPIPAIDNFRRVMHAARGEFFMWAAHDDLRDLDFIDRLLHELSDRPSAVLAFGDLFLLREAGGPEPCEFEFDTSAMSWRQRMTSTARRQCFHIYGLWRTAALRRLPLLPCEWWPDLPVMIGAAWLGEFVHVRGTCFVYRETPKTNLEQAKRLHLQDSFNLVSGVLDLIVTTHRSVRLVSGTYPALLATWLVLWKQLRGLPGFVIRRLGRFIGK